MIPHPLSTGGADDPLLPRILAEIPKATHVDIAVSFVLSSGLSLIFDALSEAIEARSEPLQVRLLTSDYLGITDPRALRRLMLLSERGADVRVFEARNQSFHLKTYVFLRTLEGRLISGSAYIGSSNLSGPALTTGIEWNWRVDAPTATAPDGQDSHFAKFQRIREGFDQLFDSAESRTLTYGWIEDYEKRRPALMPHRPSKEEGASGPVDEFGLMAVPIEIEEDPVIPEPRTVQSEALVALDGTRVDGHRRGLVVMATGLGKTWLAAFDVRQLETDRVLYIAHREEILLQAESTFQQILPNSRIGRYDGSNRDVDSDLLFASVQTLSRQHHLSRFPPGHFDYIVVDEFHHASAPTYRRILGHFRPRFLLGITATPGRTDQSDILTLCDDNLVYTCSLFDGIRRNYLVPFHYFGILDTEVDYEAIPWRNGRFDPDQLSNRLATLARSRHVLREWQERGQNRTLAFCASRRHADFMAQRFRREGISAVSVHGGKVEGAEPDAYRMSRSEAIAALAAGEVQVLFSVDLFNEGVDIPAVETVMMLRPTESQILFLQQLGRGLRRFEGKDRLTVLDFIGNHKSFLAKPQALMGLDDGFAELAEFARQARKEELNLPPGCFVNFDLEFLDFLESLNPGGLEESYQRLRDTLGRRPTAAEFYRGGGAFQKVRAQYGQWWKLVQAQGDLAPSEEACLASHGGFLLEVETTAMTRSFKMVLLQALIENDGVRNPPTLAELSEWSLAIFQRDRGLAKDLGSDVSDVGAVDPRDWLRYWKKNPINAWVGRNRADPSSAFFSHGDGRFVLTETIDPGNEDAFINMVEELVAYRMAQYRARSGALGGASTESRRSTETDRVSVAYFTELPIACGHFKKGRTDPDDLRKLPPRFGPLEPARHFLAHARGNSMVGATDPIRDGDLLLLEYSPEKDPRALVGERVVLERTLPGEDSEYLLRSVSLTDRGAIILRADAPGYGDLELGTGIRPVATVRSLVDPMDIRVGEEFLREEIPPLFGAEFNPGNWHAGHVVLRDPSRHVLLATLNKQGRLSDYRYVDGFMPDGRFRWQSQNRTIPTSKWGAELVHHEERKIPVYLFVREYRLRDGKAAPFVFHGRVRYDGHEGSGPMNVVWRFD